MPWTCDVSIAWHSPTDHMIRKKQVITWTPPKLRHTGCLVHSCYHGPKPAGLWRHRSFEVIRNFWLAVWNQEILTGCQTHHKSHTQYIETSRLHTWRTEVLESRLEIMCLQPELESFVSHAKALLAKRNEKGYGDKNVSCHTGKLAGAKCYRTTRRMLIPLGICQT